MKCRMALKYTSHTYHQTIGVSPWLRVLLYYYKLAGARVKRGTHSQLPLVVEHESCVPCVNRHMSYIYEHVRTSILIPF